jgi:hypothetical protein
MKKVIYTAILVVASMAIITSCTEDEVTPTAETSNGGGSGSTGPIKP